MAFLRLDKHNRALQDADRCIAIDPSWIKGYFRKSSALHGLQRYADAIDVLKIAATLEPGNVLATQEIKKITAEMNDKRSLKRSEEYLGTASMSSSDVALAFSASSSVQSETPAGENSHPSSSTDNATAATSTSSTSTLPAAYRQESADELVRQHLKDIDHFLRTKTPEDLQPAAGFRKTSTGEDLSRVSLDKAFSSPDTRNEAVRFLREHAAERGADAMIMLVPRSAIAFPQVWAAGLGASKWRCGSKQGVFVQLETVKMRRMWFIPFKHQVRLPEAPVELDSGVFALVPPIFMRT